MRYYEIINCQYCGKNRVRYIKGKNVCQRCYREMLDRYSLFDYREGEMTEMQKKICDKIINGERNVKRISKALGCSEIYVYQTMEKKLKRIDTDGNERPF